MTEKEKLDYLKSQGINIETGMRYADESFSFYEELIGIFLEEYEKKSENVKKEAANLGKGYTVLVHGLKNNAKALGAEKLAELAYQHEQASRENSSDYIEKHLNELLDLWQETVQIFGKIKQLGSKNDN